MTEAVNKANKKYEWDLDIDMEETEEEKQRRKVNECKFSTVM